MPHTAAKLLATGKGFGLCDARSAGEYYLFDSLTGLPAVNLRQGKMWFTLQEVVEFLDSLVGRPRRQSPQRPLNGASAPPR
jgi:hypothetical protein